MKVKVYYEGNVYIGKVSDDNLDETAEDWFTFIKHSNSIKLPLEDGSILIAGKEVIQKAVFILTE